MHRIYAVASYFPNAEGKMVPEIPKDGPCKDWDNCLCKIYADHYRDRKTGPCFPILIVRCMTHKVSFTIYPFGFNPYGRSRLAPVAADGKLAVDEKDIHRFAGTYFDAAIDAAKPLAWRHWYQEQHSHTPSFITQTRHLERLSTWFGVDTDSTQAQSEVIMRLLNVPGQILHDSAQVINEHAGYHHRGMAICNILKDITFGSSLFERLAAVGSGIGFWPPLYILDNSNHFRPSPFRAIGTRPSPD